MSRGGRRDLAEGAKIAAPLFADTRYTDKPINVVFVYGDQDVSKPAEATVYFEGKMTYALDAKDLIRNIDNINELFIKEKPDRARKIISQLR